MALPLGALMFVVLLVSCSAQEGDEFLDQCELIGFKAGRFVKRAGCAAVLSVCPEPRGNFETEASGRTAGGLFRGIIRDTCGLLFQTSCEAAAWGAALADKGACANILRSGPDVFDPPLDSCPDIDFAHDIFIDITSRLCNRDVPDLEPAPPPDPEAAISFKAFGNNGQEIIAGVQVTLSNQRTKQLLPVTCEESGSGELSNDAQNCTAVIPSELDFEDVRGVQVVFANPDRAPGEKDHNIIIVDGQVWFRGRNIWRSAVDTTNLEVLDNVGGQLEVLRLGTIYWSEGLMFAPPADAAVWFEAKGEIGTEIVTVEAVKGDGTTVEIPITCSVTGTGELQTVDQVCTGEFDGSYKDVTAINIGFNEDDADQVVFKRGRFFFFGVNVLWKAEDPGISAPDLWKLRAGFMTAAGVEAPVNQADYRES